MRDQAEGLRRLALEERRPREAREEGSPVIVVGSGKGGVGKSVIAVRLAAALAKGGRRTLLCDGTQHRGHLHVMLGVRPVAQLESVLLRGGDPGKLLTRVAGDLWLLPSPSGSEALAGLGPTDRAHVHFRLSRVFPRFDTTVLDADSGIDGVVRAITMHPSRLLLVVTPEPASLADAYALAKIALARAPELAVDVLVNRAMDESEGGAAFERINEAAQRFLGRELSHLGTLPEDPAVSRAVRRPGALLTLPGHEFGAVATALRERCAVRADGPAEAPDSAARLAS